MRVVCIIFFLLVTMTGKAQDSTHYYRVGATGFMVPSKNFFYLEGEVDKRYDRFSFGIRGGHLRFNQVITDITLRNYYVGVGTTFHVLRRSRFSIDPSVHAVYHYGDRSSDGSYFNGGGLLASLRLTYSIYRFEFGLKSNTILTYGQSHFLNSGLKIRGFYFDDFRFGVNIGYKIP